MNQGIKDLTADLEKSFGKGAFFRVGDRPVVNIELISSGSIILDEALGGGYAKGRIVEIFGWESSGKTTLTLHAMAEAQKAGGNVAFIDAEHALDPEYATKLGVNVAELFLAQPDNGEQALEILDRVVESGQFAMIVVDSVSALTPKAELEGDMGESKMGLHARLMSQALRKITAKVNKANCSVIFINQLREKIGVVFGNPQVTTGGNALKFYASQRLEVARSTQIKEGEEVLGHLLRIKVVKNKIAPPFKTANTRLLYGIGISRMDELIDICVSKGIIKKSGTWFKYADANLGQGQNKVRDMLLENPDLVDELEKKIKEDE